MISFNTCRIIKFLFSWGLIVFFASSCSDEKRVQSNYIPSDASAVITINTETIFNSAAFDLLGNSDLMNNINLGPISDIVQNSSSSGLEMFANYHLFVSGSNLVEAKIGAILPLSDCDDFSDYLVEYLHAEIIKSDGLKTAKIDGNHNVVWDDYTAIYYSGISKENLINEIKLLFDQKNKITLADKDSTFSFSLNSNSHISTWIKNGEIGELIDQGVSLLKDLNVIDLPLNKNNRFDESKTVLLTNFRKGNITTKQISYLSSNQIKEYNTSFGENKLASVLTRASSENPLLLVNTFLKPEILVDILKLFKLDEGWTTKNANSSVFTGIDQLTEYIQGNVMVLLDSSEEVVKIKQIPDIDDEGNDILVSREVIKKVPNISLGFLIKDSVKFNFTLNFLGALLPKEDGFFNYNNDIYFAVKGDCFFITSTKKGIKSFKKNNSLLSSDLKTTFRNNKSVYYINLSDILQQNLANQTFSFEGIENVNNIIFHQKNTVIDGILEGQLKINFMNQNENGLISIFKLISGITSMYNSLGSIGVK